MSYFYNDNYMVKETKKAFLVSELFQEDLKTVRIKKSEVEELGLSEEPEMVAILLAEIELIRMATTTEKWAPKKIVKKREFKEELHLILKLKTIDEVISEVYEMKYHEVEEYFISRTEERVDYEKVDEDSYD